MLEGAVLDWLTHLDVERGLAAHTLSAYRRDLGRYVSFTRRHGITDPADVSEETVTEPTDKVVAEGTKEKPAEDTSSESSSGSSSS